MIKRIFMIAIAFSCVAASAFAQTEMPVEEPVIPILYGEHKPEFQEVTAAIARLKQRHPGMLIKYSGGLTLLWNEDTRNVVMVSQMPLKVVTCGDILSEDIDDCTFQKTINH